MTHEGFNRAALWVRMVRIINISLSFSAACSGQINMRSAAGKHCYRAHAN
jgi:hypothetical protein